LGGLGAAEAVRLTVVSAGVQSVLGDEALRPEGATILAACRGVSSESPRLACRSVDLSASDLRAGRAEVLANQLLAELVCDAGEEAVAYRHGRRWVESLEAIRLSDEGAGRSRLKPGGAYLILGSPDGAGLAVAAQLARDAGAKLAVALPPAPSKAEEREGRSASRDGGRSEALRELRELGAEIMPGGAGAAWRDALPQVLSEARRRLGALHGIIHLGGAAGRRIETASEELRARWRNSCRRAGSSSA
jgi:hypothetical protein